MSVMIEFTSDVTFNVYEDCKSRIRRQTCEEKRREEEVKDQRKRRHESMKGMEVLTSEAGKDESLHDMRGERYRHENCSRKIYMVKHVIS